MLQDLLLKLALNLNDTLSAQDRNQRLLDVVAASLPCDSACLLGLEYDGEAQVLAPLASYGLDSSVALRKFYVNEHPRLEVLVNAPGPIVFPENSHLPDPFDGLVAQDHSASLDVHSCFGCPLRVEGKIVGALVADALEPGKFGGLNMDFLSMIAALAGATLRTSNLIETLEKQAQEESLLRKSLVADVNKSKSTPLLGVSSAIEHVRKTVELVGPSEFSILITGETGVGKEIVSRMIHRHSPRRDNPLIYVNCAALPENIVESELFGHVKGAFTGAVSDRLGKFHLAKGGTLFLDEVGELPLGVQAKLLRALQEGEIQRVGSDTISKVDVRIVAATNRDLEKEVSQGKFRADLFHRLNVYPLHVPPLRERQEDIPVLLSYYGDVCARRIDTPPVRINKEALEALKSYPWPGNVRELKNALSRAALSAKGKSGATKILGLGIEDFHFLNGAQAAPVSAPAKENSAVTKPFPLADNLPLRTATEEFQKQLVLSRLETCDKNWSATARSLGMHRSNLHHLAVKLGLK